MSELYKYKAFGLVVQSEVEIAQIPIADKAAEADVAILLKDLREYSIENEYCRIKSNELLFAMEKAGKFRVVDGNRIEVDPAKECGNSLLGAYLMGSGMGAILHQRGYMPLHGSCVTDGENAILIVGDSGVGKSTLAAEFLSRGWKLITDDVAAISNVETKPLVWASYPSQKLWQDSMEQYENNQNKVHSLYVSENREKFGIDVSAHFYDGSCPLKMIVRLITTDVSCAIEPVKGMVRVDQLMRNTYRVYMVAPENRERHFRRCVALASKVPMVLVARQTGLQCATELYDMITNNLWEKNNG